MANLWQHATAGMSESEVIALFPQALPSKNGEVLASGAVSRLEIPNYIVSGRDFTVKFFFGNNSLEQIVLGCADLREDDRENIALYGKIVDLLSAKYGRPVSENDSEYGATLTSYTRDWMVNGVKVMFVYLSVQGKSPVMNINCQSKNQEEIDKL